MIKKSYQSLETNILHAESAVSPIFRPHSGQCSSMIVQYRKFLKATQQCLNTPVTHRGVWKPHHCITNNLSHGMWHLRLKGNGANQVGFWLVLPHLEYICQGTYKVPLSRLLRLLIYRLQSLLVASSEW